MPAQTNNKQLLFDPFLSDHLAKETFRLVAAQGLEEETPAALRNIQSRDVFIYTKIPAASAAARETVEKLGFRLVDTQITLEKELGSPDMRAISNDIRLAKPGDEEQTVTVAGRAFQYSRFHADPQVSIEAANRVKAEWVRNYFKGQRGCAMVLGCLDHRVAGFVQLLKSDNILVIDLIAVDVFARKRGLASDMIRYAEAHCAESCGRCRVGTQSDNLPSLALYEKLGFEIVTKDCVYHFHS